MDERTVPPDREVSSTPKPGANRVVERLLASRFHRLLSGSTVVVRYRGRRSGKTFTTPVQYARYGSAIVVAVAHPDDKTWWRNFREERDLDVLLAGTWVPMTGLVVDPREHAPEAAPLVTAYLERFPKTAKTLGAAGEFHAPLVWCRPC